MVDMEMSFAPDLGMLVEGYATTGREALRAVVAHWCLWAEN